MTGTSPRPSTQVFRVYQEHTFTDVGPHNVIVTASDGNATVTRAVRIVVESFNLPPDRPRFDILRENGTKAGNNTFRLSETVVIRILVSDPENDSLEVTVNWEDGSKNTTEVNFTTAQGCGFVAIGNFSQYACTVTVSHRYTDVGSGVATEFTVLVAVTDHQVYYQQDPNGGPPIQLNHAPSLPVILIITNYQPTGLGPWDWWDYSTFAAIVGVPGILIGRWIVNIQRERREE